METSGDSIVVGSIFRHLAQHLGVTPDSLSTTLDKMNSERARLERILPPDDTDRLLRMEAIYVSNHGKLLSYSLEDCAFSLVETVYNGFIPEDAMFVAPYSCLTRMLGVISREQRRVEFGWLEDDRVRGELSGELSKFIWPLDQDVIHVQFRTPWILSRVQPFGNVKVVFGNSGGGDGGYCLAACNDGTVKWLPPSECGNGNHVWTVHLFDDPCGEVHLSQRLRRIGPNVHNGHVINNHIGGNINGPDSAQNIASVNLHIS